MKTLKTGRLFRAIAFDRSAVDEENRTVGLSFSSEEPYDRWFGTEILDHGAKSVRLDRLRNTGPLLLDHDPTKHIGVVEGVTIGTDRTGRAVVRFGKGALAEEIYNDVKDGIRKSVSVGYMIHRMVLEEEKEGHETYRAVDWEPLEVSLVSIPADTTVGVGRNTEEAKHETIIENFKEARAMEKEIEVKAKATPPTPNIEEIRGEERKAERQRASEISALGKLHKMDDLAGEHIGRGTTLDEFRVAVLEKLGKIRPIDAAAAEIGMSDREARGFSFLRAINALSNPTDRRAREAAKFEFEVSDAVAKKLGREAQGVFIPQDVQKRDLTSGTATTGGNTVATDLLAASFIDLLRNRLILRQMGATMLTGLMGNVAIPRQSSGATAYWVAENVVPTESEPAFDQVTMAPKTVGTFTDMSRKLLLQSSIDVEALVRNDLAKVLGLEIDRVGINGLGSSGQPKGILKQTGIGDVAGGTNGLAPTWAHLISLWSITAAANADFGSTGFLTNPKVIGKLATTLKGSSTMDFIASALPDANGMMSLAGARCGVSNQVPSTLTKGSSGAVCSAIIYGNFADLIIGQWGALDILVDPYTGSAAGTVRVRVLQDVDVAVRHPSSFTAMQDAKTT